MGIQDAARELFPPDLKPLQRWRVLMFGAVVGLMGAAVWGEITHAKDSDMKSLSQVARSIQLSALATRIRELEKEKCDASDRLRDLLDTEISDLQKEYKDTDGAYYPVTIRCSEASE